MPVFAFANFLNRAGQPLRAFVHAGVPGMFVFLPDWLDEADLGQSSVLQLAEEVVIDIF